MRKTPLSLNSEIKLTELLPAKNEDALDAVKQDSALYSSTVSPQQSINLTGKRISSNQKSASTMDQMSRQSEMNSEQFKPKSSESHQAPGDKGPSQAVKPQKSAQVSMEQSPNCTIYIIYKRNKIQLKLNITSQTVKWLNQRLMQAVYEFEKNNLQSEDPRREIEKIVTFQSANKNISVSYYLTLLDRDLDIFENATLSLEPLFLEIIPHQRDFVNLKDFNFIKCIGLGGFSRVYLVQQKTSGKMFALKLIDKMFIIKNKKEVIVQNERNIMTQIAHPFLLKLEYAFESNYFIGFVMEYCAGGELFYHLRRIKRMTEDQARFYFTEICLGIQYLHEKYIIYRDIKPENIFLDIDGHVRIGDFGLSKPQMDENEFAYSFCGSPEYMAPGTRARHPHPHTRTPSRTFISRSRLRAHPPRCARWHLYTAPAS